MSKIIKRIFLVAVIILLLLIVYEIGSAIYIILYETIIEPIPIWYSRKLYEPATCIKKDVSN